MSVIGSNILAGASGQGGGYNLTKSLRFRSSASAYLNRTLGTPTNSKIWTYSGWVKRGSFASYGMLLTGGTSISAFGEIYFDQSTSALIYFDNVSGASLTTSAVYRDPSAWYHIVVAVDTTQATSSNRAKIYVNGTQITAFSSATYPTQNSNTAINTSGYLAGLSALYAGSWMLYADQYLTEQYFIDGQQLTPSSFGETSTTTGVWIPKKYTGTYGTNGFYLPFTDTTSTSTLGTDFSGNSNTWTVNNISLTSGSTYDSMTDVPTLTSATAANYCVMNPLDNYATTITNGNLQLTGSSSAWNTTRSTFAMPSGSWYCELTSTSGTGNGNSFVGIAPQSTPLSSISNSTFVGGTSTSWAYSSNGNTYTNGSVLSSTGTTWASGSVIGISFTGSELKFYKNNTLVTTISSISTDSYCITTSFYSSDAGAINFGQRPFAYTPPTGFVALNTYNLPTPTIGATASTTANKYFNANLYTGNAGSNTISGVSFQPDFIWAKSRSNGAAYHGLWDVVRGSNNLLYSNGTDAEANVSNLNMSPNADGFSINGGNSSFNLNTSSQVAWNWKANGSGSTNTAGSITSTVSANTTAGFSIVTYTGTGANATVGHGLGVAPSMIIGKSRSQSGWWICYHQNMAASPATGYLALQLTNAFTTQSTVWNNTAPTSSVFSLGSAGDLNTNGATNVAYCFAQVAGYSAFGSYTGNGSSDGPFIFTGFRPRFVMIKITSSTGNWDMLDTSRNTSNLTNYRLFSESSSAELTGAGVDILSNGFKIRNTDTSYNSSGQTYIYMAFCESPFKFSNAR